VNVTKKKKGRMGKRFSNGYCDGRVERLGSKEVTSTCNGGKRGIDRERRLAPVRG